MKKTTIIAGILGVTALMNLSTIASADPSITRVETTVEKAVEHADHAQTQDAENTAVDHEAYVDTTVTTDDEINADVDANTDANITTDDTAEETAE